MHSTEPGIVFVREFADSDEIRINILKSSFPVGHPDIIPSKGLLPERKQYLFKEIRQFCKTGYADLVAPHPDRFKATNHTKNITFGAENRNKFFLSRVMLLFDYTKEYAEYICLM